MCICWQVRSDRGRGGGVGGGLAVGVVGRRRGRPGARAHTLRRAARHAADTRQGDTSELIDVTIDHFTLY